MLRRREMEVQEEELRVVGGLNIGSKSLKGKEERIRSRRNQGFGEVKEERNWRLKRRG